MILSVVIPTLDKVELLRRTLAALEGQEPGEDRPWEVVVVDDGSSDGTAPFLRERSRSFAGDLKIVTPGRNLGRAKARNLGARTACGRWLLFLDDDIVAPPGLLRAHLDLLEANPGDGTIGWAVTDDDVRDAPHFHYLDTRGVARLGAGPAPARYFVTQNAAVPRMAFLAVGGFDEDFSAYGFEDMEVAFRLADEAKVRFHALPAPVPSHVHHHTLAAYFGKKIECGRSSLPQLARRHPARVVEMRLDLVLPGPSGDGGWLGRGIRAFTDGPAGPWLRRRLEGWPAGEGGRPRWPAAYLRLMDLAILSCFREGLRDAGHV